MPTQPASAPVSSASTTAAPAAYARLERRFARLLVLEDTLGMLQWDLSTMMQEGSANGRADQIATLSGLRHELLTAEGVADDLAEAESAAGALDPWQAANLREMRGQYAHAVALPGDLVEALSRATSACEQVWRKARPASDFAMVREPLSALLALVREAAQAKSAALGKPLYDSLLDEYQPGTTSAEVDSVFADLEDFLPGFLDEALERQGPAPAVPEGPFPIAIQQAVARQTMETLGFDFTRGRLDISLHPFCGGTPDDVRLTTRYDESDFASAIMGVIHETGHALYELGLPRAHTGQPVGRARGMAIHESQSLLFEMQACRSAQFIAHAAPRWQAAFNADGPAWAPDSLARHYTRVERGFIRVDADEVTYPAHVILRYRLEKAMIEGSLEVADLPGAWNEGMQRLLGVSPPDDRRGCLQDIHWYDGAWGYFPTYTLGAMIAAQLFDAAVTAVPEIPDALGRGDFGPLLGWLRPNVHEKGCLLSADELVRQATGRPLDAGVFKAHLRRRYIEER